ncbi:MAG: TIGR04442 family protein [Proteobacteria bacterium]|nr:TIGR04442 family protein [Pseudomonadota bacterium]
MIRDIRLHGQVNNIIEFYATISGENIDQRYFYTSSSEKDSNFDRFFAPGNEFIISKDGVTYNCNGGSVCEYMFGVEQPFQDMVKKDVLNRLAIYGTYYGEDEEKLVFSNNTTGFDSYSQMFFDMHAVSNYYFFLQLDKIRERKEEQELILKAIGKRIKRNTDVGDSNDVNLAQQILKDVNIPGAALFLFRIVNRPNQIYYEMFEKFYYEKKAISEEEEKTLREVADKYDIDQYQQERIKIDVMYKDHDNKTIIDEYKDVLISMEQDGSEEGKALINPKLTRLRTLSVRNNIPLALFDKLDNLILKGKEIVKIDEPDYILETREVLEGLFLMKGSDSEIINNEDLHRLLIAKKTSVEMRDRTFEGILLDTGRICDEKMNKENDTTALENFGYIVTFFDRYDATSTILSQLSFMEKDSINEDQVRSLLGHKKAFDELENGLFRRLFFEPIMENSYLAFYGRGKITALLRGLEQVEKGESTLQKVVEGLKDLSREESLYNIIHNKVKDRIRTFYSELNTKEEQTILKREVGRELIKTGVIKEEIPAHIFDKVVMNIKKEAIYLQNLLPQIINTTDSLLREDFIINSGLDRFYIEELEREYFRVNSLAEEDLNNIRKLAD